MRLQLLCYFTLAIATAFDPHADKRCTAVTFSVTIAANNSIFNNSPDPSNTTQIDSSVSAFLVGGGQYMPVGSRNIPGTYNIATTYCDSFATIRPKRRARSLQVLVHGATYNSTYWSGLGFNRYSWVATALDHGHATLSIDRLGHGLSDHPDPISTLQLPLHIETIHQIVSVLRASKSHGAELPTFDHIVYVGHSFGSYIGNGVSNRYPKDFDAVILTGYSNDTNFPTPIRLIDFKTTKEAPGLDAINHGLNSGYVRATNESGRTDAFYGKRGSFDPAVSHFDFVHSDTSAVGELFSQGGFSRSKFEGPVFLVSGSSDAVFCDESHGPCESQLRRAQSLFPNASRFDTYVAPGSGHCLNLDFAAPATFNKVQSWIKSLHY